MREYLVEDGKIYEIFYYEYKLLLNHIFLKIWFLLKRYPLVDRKSVV